MENEVKVAEKLTDKKELFVQEYLVDFNATRAAKSVGYSEASAATEGWRLLRNEDIQLRISELRKVRAGKLDITKESLMAILQKMASFDKRNMYDEKGNLKPITELDDVTIQGISSFEVEESDSDYDEDIDDFGETVRKRKKTLTKKVKTTDPRAAIETLNKMLGFNAADKLAFTDPEGNTLPPVININIIQPGDKPKK